MKVFLILGNKLEKNCKISSILKKRLQCFLKIDDGVSKVIVSGGNVAKEKHTEAFIMRKYLINKELNGVKNVDDKRILLENKSKDTYENIYFSLKVLRKLSREKNRVTKLVIVTSESHKKKVERVIKEGNLEMCNISIITC